MRQAFITGNVNRERQIAFVEQRPHSGDAGIPDVSVNDKVDVGIPSVVSRGPGSEQVNLCDFIGEVGQNGTNRLEILVVKSVVSQGPPPFPKEPGKGLP